MDKNVTKLKIGKSKKYKIKIIWNNMVYKKKVKIRLFTKSLLFNFMKRLSRRKKYLEANFSNSAF